MITCILKSDLVLIATDYKMLNAFESVKLQFIGNNPYSAIYIYLKIILIQLCTIYL